MIQSFVDQHDMHNFFQAAKVIYGQIATQDGTLLNDDSAIHQQRREHFEMFLNRETVVTEDTILSIPQHPETASHPVNHG